jgi:uncharacterized damage-inducible protein DinB
MIVIMKIVTKAVSKNECYRMADQLRRAFEGNAWHGPAVNELLADVSAMQAVARPIGSAHSIWELLLHIEAWERVAIGAISGTAMPKPMPPEQDFPRIAHEGETAFATAKDLLFKVTQQLAAAIERFDANRLEDTVPGRSYDFYHLFHGMTQHALYHAGQIALLKKAVQASA